MTNDVEVDVLFKYYVPLVQSMFVHVQVDYAGKLCM